MSKMDGLRAMREARYAQQKARGATTGAAKPTVARKVAERAPEPVAPGPAAAEADVEADAEAAEELCGHRNMSGRTCTREQGHAAKSHRYS
jgi:uncharacterized protein (DUF2342 family)